MLPEAVVDIIISYKMEDLNLGHDFREPDENTPVYISQFEIKRAKGRPRIHTEEETQK